VLELRARLQRALLATLLLSQGTPMLAAGDELGHTQQGNNNPYCQDNAITWIDWSRADEGLVADCAQLIALRRSLRPLADTWQVDGTGDAGLSWLQATGLPLSGADWDDPASRTIGVRIGQPGRAARPLLLLVNAGDRALDFKLPPGHWKLLFDSSVSGGTQARPAVEASALSMVARCVLLLQLSED
jgi:pullulanase/glycogen debranching enzyme